MRSRFLAVSLLAMLFASMVAAQTTFNTTTTLPLAVPDSVPAGMTLDIPVTGLTSDVIAVSLEISFSTTHTWAGDIIITLTAPAGVAASDIMNRVGRTGGSGAGDSSDLTGPYIFVDGGGDFWVAAAAAGATAPIPPGSYAARTVDGGAVTLNAVFGGLTSAQANGTWTVNVSDNAGGDTGSIGALSITITTTPEIDVERPAGTSVSDPDDVGNLLTGTTTNVTWTIVNNGGSDLIITGNSVALSGGFNLTSLPGSVAIDPTGPIAPAGSATFVVGINPTADAPFGFTVTIASNDPVTASFVFDVEGDGVSNAPPTLALGTPSDFADLGSNTFRISVDPGATITDGNLEVADATPEDVDMTITFIGGPMGMTVPSGFTVPGSQVVTVASMPFTIQWGGTAGAGDAPGDYEWDVELDDGTSIVNYTVYVHINDLDPEHAPVTGVTGDGSSGDPYSLTIQIGATADVDVADLTDPNAGQDVVFDGQTLIDRPGSSSLNFTFSVTAGNPTVLVATPASAPVLADVGDHEYSVVVEDDGGNDVTIFVTITVAGTAPAFTSATPPATAAEGLAFSFTFTASGNPAPTFAVTTGTLPTGWSLDSVTGELSCASPVLTEDVNVTISAQNGIAPDATLAVTITVAAAVAPTITSAAPTATATVGVLYSFTITATGNPTPTFSIAGNPAWLSINPTTGLVSGTPGSGDVGPTGSITVTATNGAGTDDVTWTITVSAATTPPTGGDGKKKKSRCSTDEGSSYLLLALLGLIGAVVVSTRLRRA